jgi:hypothetical protein
MESQVLISCGERNKSTSLNSDASLTPKISAPNFEMHSLETLSLADFAGLLEAAGLMPTGNDKVLSAKEVATTPFETEQACLDRLRNSRFGFLVEHFYTGDRLIRDVQLEQNPNDPTRVQDSYAIAGLLTFLHMARGLFFQILAVKREETNVGLVRTPRAEPGQHLFAAFTSRLAAAWSVGKSGRLERRPTLGQVNLAGPLVERLLKVIDGADPARVRQCAFKTCQKIFYAKRVDQLCCSRRCNNNRIQRRWYEEHGKSAVYVRVNHRERKG